MDYHINPLHDLAWNCLGQAAPIPLLTRDRRRPGPVGSRQAPYHILAIKSDPSQSRAYESRSSRYEHSPVAGLGIGTHHLLT